MQIFARITKVDESTGKVYGRAVQEVPDRSGEIFDYESSKPNFVKWSGDIAKVTDGKSVGNVRAMHGKVAAGKLSELNFIDAEKAIDVCAEIVDPVEREKCVKGVYTGFSIGGRYAKKWADESNASLTRYTAEPMEISLVDLPCIPTAQFTVVKSDGTEELRKFETTTEPDSLAKWADGLSDAEAAALAEKIARRKGVNPKEGEHKYGAVEYADEKNKKYPIDSEEHIRAAWSYIHMPKNAAKYDAADVGTIKRKIIAAWKAKIDSKGPPDAEKFAGFDELLAKAVADDDQDSIAHISEVIASMTTENDDLEKVGRKHTRAMREHRKMMAHHLDEAKKHLDAMAADDPANDPDDDGDDDAEKLAKASGDLAKVTAERDDLKKQIDEINAAAAELRKQLEAQPLPPKGAVTAVDKTVGLPNTERKDPEPVLKSDGSIDHLATATELAKAIYRKG